jgi:hypothetical protein
VILQPVQAVAALSNFFASENLCNVKTGSAFAPAFILPEKNYRYIFPFQRRIFRESVRPLSSIFPFASSM